MEVVILNEHGDESGKLEVLDSLFMSDVNKNVLYEAIKNELANKRQGTHSTKTRAEVSGGGRKPWRQKGTGRARAGSTRSPVWVGGGKSHTPKPRDYSYRLPRKVKRKALLSVLSMKYSTNMLKVYEDFTFEQAKTKRMASFISKAKGPNSRRIAFVVGKEDALGDNYNKLLLSLRNIKDLKLVNADSMSIHPLYYADEIYFTKTALSKLNKRVQALV